MHMMKKGHVGNHPVKKIVFNYAFLRIILENFFFLSIIVIYCNCNYMKNKNHAKCSFIDASRCVVKK